MLWNRATAIHFCTPGVKLTTKIYEETVLELVMKPPNGTLLKGQHWIFQQDSASAHKSKCFQEWLANDVPAFIRTEGWALDSPDLNPLDYELGHFGTECMSKTPFKFGVA